MKPKKYFLYFSVFIFSSMLVVGFLRLRLYSSLDVELLSNQYPHFNKKEQRYVLMSGIPRGWIPLSKISKFAKNAIMISEDWAFYQHTGVDKNQLMIVIKESIEAGKFVRGASTISQQVVKNIFLTKSKTLSRKFKEYILTQKLEDQLTKDRILELYLNIIEFGKDLYGIKNASRFYFNKMPSKLTARESAFLAMLLPNPKKYSISFRKKELTPYALETINNILVKLRQARVYKEKDRLVAMKERFHWEKKVYKSDESTEEEYLEANY